MREALWITSRCAILWHTPPPRRCCKEHERRCRNCCVSWNERSNTPSLQIPASCGGRRLRSFAGTWCSSPHSAMSLEHSPSVVFLMGPTCAGKTAVAMDLVERLPCEIVSVDSAMIYSVIYIGTAKPSTDELTRAPHRLNDNH